MDRAPKRKMLLVKLHLKIQVPGFQTGEPSQLEALFCLILETARESTPPPPVLVCSPDAHNSWGWLRLEPAVRNSIQVSHGSLHCGLPGSAPAGTWSQEPELDTNPRDCALGSVAS